MRNYINKDIEKRKVTYPIPNFFAKTDSDTEAIAMEVEYIGKKIVELSREINNARESEKRIKLYDKRECYIEELKKRPERLQAAAKFII